MAKHFWEPLVAEAVASSDDPAAKREEVEIKGAVSSPVDPAPRCRFYDRCPLAAEIFEISDHPPLEEVGSKHLVACYRV